MQAHGASRSNAAAQGSEPKPDGRGLPSGMWLAESDQETPRIASFRPNLGRDRWQRITPGRRPRDQVHPVSTTTSRNPADDHEMNRSMVKSSRGHVVMTTGLQRVETSTTTIGPWPRNHVHQRECLTALREIPSDIFDVTITSPPYWGQRGDSGLGSEKDPREYVENLVIILPTR